MPENITPPQHKEEIIDSTSPRKRAWRIAGFALLLLSAIPWLIMPVLPFLGFSAAKVATLTTVLFIAAEVFFYSGIAILGKEFYNKLKPRLNPRNWFKRGSGPQPATELEPGES